MKDKTDTKTNLGICEITTRLEITKYGGPSGKLQHRIEFGIY
jgi:hypothetical protein